MATTPSLTAQAAQAQRELAVATKTLAAAQNTVIAAQKAGRTPSPEALAAVEAATTAVKSTQLASNNATAAVTSAAGKTPPSTGPGVPEFTCVGWQSKWWCESINRPGQQTTALQCVNASAQIRQHVEQPPGLVKHIGFGRTGCRGSQSIGHCGFGQQNWGDFQKHEQIFCRPAQQYQKALLKYSLRKMLHCMITWQLEQATALHLMILTEYWQLKMRPYVKNKLQPMMLLHFD
jgi:hypothetical protein